MNMSIMEYVQERRLLLASKEIFEGRKIVDVSYDYQYDTIFLDNELVGFFYVRFGGQNVAWLEDLFIIEAYRNKGIGKIAMQKLDELMIERGVVSMFVDVIPRNTSAIKLYRECGFDHLNIIQLRKNYDERLNKKDDIEILGFNFKKY